MDIFLLSVQLKATLTHGHSADDLGTSFTATWGSSQRVQLDVTGHHVTGRTGGSIVLQSPWSVAREWRVDVENQYNWNKITSTSSIKVSEF
jgi:hypothetical protein